MRGRLIAAVAALTLMPGAAVGQTGDPDAGKEVYDKACAQCHGGEGGADGAGAEFMLPRPRVFKENISYKFRTTPSGALPTEQDLFNIITRGLPGSAMPGFDVLPAEQRWDVVAYIMTLAEDFEDEDALEEAVPLEELIEPPARPPISEESLAKGKELFTQNKCWQCHGEAGRGNGPSFPDLKDEWQDPILPTDLTIPEVYRGGAEPFDIYRTISTGLNGTPMPAYKESITPEDRWHLVNYIVSMHPDTAATSGDVVTVAKVDELPADAGDEAWSEIPTLRVPLSANVIEPPRLFWNSVEYVLVQGAYDGDQIALRVQWHDRTNSKGTDTDKVYKDRDTTIYADTQHPDQIAVQFPAKNTDPGVRPYFMHGDGKKAVNLWTWRADSGAFAEVNAKGFPNQAPQPEKGQTLQGESTFEDGRYTVMMRRDLTNDDKRNDIQFEPGVFVPIAFHAWDGSRGEVGQRRSLTTWYWLQLQPEIPERVRYIPPIAWLGTFFGLLWLVGAVRRRSRA